MSKNATIEQKISIDMVRAQCNNYAEYVEMIDDESKRISAYRCAHTTKKGKLKVEFIEHSDVCRCKKCGTTFNFAAVKAREAKQAYITIMNAFNQLKTFSISERPDLVNRIGLTMGEIDSIVNDPLFIKIVKCDEKED